MHTGSPPALLVGSRVLGGAGQTTAPGSVSGRARRLSWRAACTSAWSLNLRCYRQSSGAVYAANSSKCTLSREATRDQLSAPRPGDWGPALHRPEGLSSSLGPVASVPAAALQAGPEQTVGRGRPRLDGSVRAAASPHFLPTRQMQSARWASTPAQGATEPGHFLKLGIKQTTSSTLGKRRGEGTKYIGCFCFLYKPHEVAELGPFLPSKRATSCGSVLSSWQTFKAAL